MPIIDGTEVLLPPPPGYVLDFAHPQRQHDLATYCLAGIGMFVMLLCVGQRLYTKIFLLQGPKLDDVLLVLGLIFAIATNIVCIYGFASKWFGVHIWEISIDKVNGYLLLTWLSSITFGLCTGFSKLALLVVYLHLSSSVWFKTSVYVTMFVVSAVCTSVTLATIFSCRPVSEYWDVLHRKTCFNVTTLYMTNTVLSLVTDIVLLVMSILVVKGLHMPRMQKFGLLAMLTIGSSTIVTATVRLGLVVDFSLTAGVDITWHLSPSTMWAVIETNLLIICASMTTLRKFFKHIAPSLMRVSSHTRSKHGQSTARRTAERSHPKSSNKFKAVSRLSLDTELQLMPTREVDIEVGLGSGLEQSSWEIEEARGKIPDMVGRESQEGIVQTTTITVTRTNLPH